MKKFIIVFLIIAMIFSLAACGKKSDVPEGWDPKLYEYAKAAYELVRDYNTGKISKADVRERVETIHKNVEALQVVDDDPYHVSNSTKQLVLKMALLSFEMALDYGGSTVDNEQNLKDILED